MPITKRSTRGRTDRVILMRPTITITDGTTLSKTEIYNGPYEDLERKLYIVARNSKSATLAPDVAGEASLTVVSDNEFEGSSNTPAAAPVVELFWAELRKSIIDHPYFSELTPAEVKIIRQLADDPEKNLDDVPPSTQSTGGFELYDRLAAGRNEYSVGVPVVRRTTPRYQGGVPAATWVRDTPPLKVPGDWEFLKTSAEIRYEGKSKSLVEEWTGANKWDPILYPLP